MLWAMHAGVRDFVVDLSASYQVGINEALKGYASDIITAAQQQIVLFGLVNSGHAMPSDIIVGVAGLYGARVHAVNGKFGGIAAFFRAAGIGSTAPHDPSEPQNAFETYMKTEYPAQVEAFNQTLGRQATATEILQLVRSMDPEFTTDMAELAKVVLSELPTMTEIERKVEGRPFVGFFDAARLVTNRDAIPDEGKSVYDWSCIEWGNDNVARLSLCQITDWSPEQRPHYAMADDLTVTPFSSKLPRKGLRLVVDTPQSPVLPAPPMA